MCINRRQEIGKGEKVCRIGVKGSGKASVDVKTQWVVSEKSRKPYPNINDRIFMTDQEVERLTKLNASGEERIAQMEAKQAERKAAQAKGQAVLAETRSKKERLLEIKARLVKKSAPKRSYEG